MEVSGSMSGPFVPRPFDAVALANWLGAPVAVLVRPVALTCYSGGEAESVHGPPGGPKLRSCVTVSHRLDSADPMDQDRATLVDVATRRHHAELRGLDLHEHIWITVANWQFTAAGQSGMTLQPGTEDSRRLRTAIAEGRMPQQWGTRMVIVDGKPLAWDFCAEYAVASHERIIGVGGVVDELLVAVAGPTAQLTRIELTWVPPDHPQ